ncbi:hypothetical protein V2A60_002426 [Cordyceps javanica]
MNNIVMPRECRDEVDQAGALRHVSYRQLSEALVKENLCLKRLLRQSGVAWSEVSREHMLRSATIGSMVSPARLPVEILLRILEFAVTSPHPIVDPLSPLCPENLSKLEAGRRNQIAIHFLATCRVMHEEGTTYLWQRNQFVFTSPQTLQKFGHLGMRYRLPIKHITLRIIARYYDDMERQHFLEAEYHPDLKQNQPLKIVDFLAALRAPPDGKHLDEKMYRSLLLPNLTSLRLDLVNFSTELVPLSGPELHDMASHQLGCQLNELHVTGLPYDDSGDKAYVELSGLLKDEGLYLSGSAAFLAREEHLQVLSGSRWTARVVRACSDMDSDKDSFDYDFDNSFSGLLHPLMGVFPPVPAERDCPVSICMAGATLWKRVPVARDSDERWWTEFSRAGGYPLPTLFLHYQ